ncbi:FAD-dependent monooxygenase [Streptomyces sp. NPDC005790]|uniref:FAD-dependent monooxygenase n=1 Tax=Streptomyces sp. NPDC005790 TaxID=3154777 RepID=UPI0033DC749F
MTTSLISATTPAAGGESKNQGTAVIVGASLAGLMTGVALARIGVQVTMLERSRALPRSGAALGGVNEQMLQRITGTDHPDNATAGRSVAASVQSWMAVHARLRAAVDADPRIEIRPRTAVRAVGQDVDAAWAFTTDHQTFRADVVIGADGHRSVVRGSVAPGKPDATFAGYLIWLGLTGEPALRPTRRFPRNVDILDSDDGILLGYPLPGPGGSTAPGSRQIGWAWYDAGHNDLLREKGSVVGNVVRHSLAPADIPEATFHELADRARALWPDPWRGAILDCIDRRAVLGTPIAEYVPDRLVNGRLALVGDAAHVPTPMTGSGFSASLHDAESIAAAVGEAMGATPMAQALRGYERERLPGVRSMVESGQQFSRSFARAAA